MMRFFKQLFQGTENSLANLSVKDVLLVDVRTPMEFSSGSVKGAINIPLDKVSNQIAKFNTTKTIVVFCQSGNRSGQAKRMLEQHGKQNVANGGAWRTVQQWYNNQKN